MLIQMLKTMTAQSKTEIENVTHGLASWPIDMEPRAQMTKEKKSSPGTVATHTSHLFATQPTPYRHKHEDRVLV